MKGLLDWLKSRTHSRSAANRTEGEDRDVSPPSLIEIHQADSSIFDTRDNRASSQEGLNPEIDFSGNAAEDMGVDPYNSGRFDIERK